MTTQLPNNHIAVTVPEGSVEKIGNGYQLYFDKMDKETADYLKSIYYEKIDIIGLGDALSEEQWKGIVDIVNVETQRIPLKKFKNYEGGIKFNYATESGLSIFTSLGLKPKENLILKLLKNGN